MSVINRTLAPSEQTKDVTVSLGALATTITRALYVAPYPVTLKQAKVYALGLSGAPQHKLVLNRFVVGAGLTSIDITAAAAVPAIGTSGLYTPSLPAAGSTLLNLQAGDYVSVVTSVANTAMAECSYSLVMQALQDIKSFYGTSY